MEFTTNRAQITAEKALAFIIDLLFRIHQHYLKVIERGVPSFIAATQKEPHSLRTLRRLYWTLTTLRDRLIKIGAKMVRHARYVRFQLAEVAIPRGLYLAILQRIRRFADVRPRAGPA
jgi:hypothetical protein